MTSAWQIAHGETPDNVQQSPRSQRADDSARTGQTGVIGTLVHQGAVVVAGERQFTTRQRIIHVGGRCFGRITRRAARQSEPCSCPRRSLIADDLHARMASSTVVVAAGGANFPRRVGRLQVAAE